MSYLIVGTGTVVLTVVAIFFHYEAASRLGGAVRWTGMSPRPRILMLFFGLLVAHILEIWLFGTGAWFLSDLTGESGIAELAAPGWLDYVYLSATTYTTVGYGDLSPSGHLRFLFGTEALAGLMLITWSASLTFIEMQAHWREE